jgi:kanosamine-6-phosphate phosphatase
MNSLNKMPCKEFLYPSVAKYLVCSDMDETYIPFDEKNKSLGGVKELEHFMGSEGINKGIVIGLITGSNINSVIKKSTNYMAVSVHFICASLGSELYWVKDGILVPSKSWHTRIMQSGYKKENIATILKLIQDNNINLVRQTDDYQGVYKDSFYYTITSNINKDFQIIEDIAQKYSIKTSFTKCNVSAGDPENTFDVEFMPACCGKDEALSFLCNNLNITKDNTLAFGDSFNDFPMLKNAGKGFLVSNADPVAKEMWHSVLKEPYCKGITSILRKI